jgi:predicted nucleic acid-binding protein
MAPVKVVSVGDTVDIFWRKTDRHDTATVENVHGITVAMRIPGPPEITIMLSADQLVAADGEHHWQLDMWSRLIRAAATKSGCTL